MKSAVSVIQELESVLVALPEIEAQLPESLRAAALKTALDDLRAKANANAAANQEWRKSVDLQEAAIKAASDLIVRARLAVRGVYGRDSLEYQKVGGKRQSEHRKPRRNTEVPSA